MVAEAVAILGGTGPEGRGLALRLARAGCEVVIGSRDVERAKKAAADLGSDLPLSGATNAAAAASATVVFVAVPWEAHEATLRALIDDLAGRIVVDLVNPMVFDAQGPVGLLVAKGSAAQQAQDILTASTVVSGFHHVSARHLLDESGPVDTDVLICGDDGEAKARVIALADRIPGVRGIDAGPLRLSGFLEGMTSVLLSVNRRYKTTTGVRLTHI